MIIRRTCARLALAASVGAASAGAAAAQGVTIRAARIIGGDGNLRSERELRVVDGRIAPTAGGGASVLDLGRYTLLPGLIDCHVHITAHFDGGDARASETALWGAHNAWQLLRSGFTTVRSLGSSRGEDLDLRDAIEAGLVPGPRLLVSGAGITDRDAPGAEGDRVGQGAAPADEAAMRGAARQRIEAGADWLKIFATRSSRSGGTAIHSLEQLEWAISEASAAGVPVATHAHSAEGARRAILAGTRTLEHGALLDEETLELMIELGVYYSPNLYLGQYYLDHAERFGFSEEALEWTARLLPTRTEVFRRAVALGVPIVFSTDANSGWIASGTTAVELERRVAAGQSPRDAIISATSRAAEALGLSDSVGDLRSGLHADVIAVDGNPLEDITALSRVVFVMKSGRVILAPE